MSQIPEKKITALICSYNNGPKCSAALNSILKQNYSNWSAYFFDDASPNNDYIYAEKFLQHYDTDKKITVIRNTTNVGPLANQWIGLNKTDITSRYYHCLC